MKKRFALAAIRFYQQRLSPGAPPACRFQPTCSHYAYEAIDAYGAVRGAGMGIWRILRCNPLNDGGLDPVPQRRNRRPDGRASDRQSREGPITSHQSPDAGRSQV